MSENLTNYLNNRIFRSWLLFFFLLMAADRSGFSLEFKKLHEYADTITLQQALQQANGNPQSPDKLYVLGLKYLSAYQTAEAEQTFRNMLAIDSQSIEARWGIAECLRRKHSFDDALKQLNEIIASHPDFYPAYISAAYLNYMSLDFKKAADLTNHVITFGENKVDLSNYVRALSLYGGSEGMLAHYGGPLASFIHGPAVFPNLNKAEALQPNSAAALFGMGGYFLLAPPLAGRNLEKAEAYLLKAVETDPLFAEIYVRLAQLYKAKGDEKKYEQYLDKAFKLDPRNVMALDVKSGACKFICP